MSDLDIRFFAPSYKRPYRSSTQELYPNVTLIVKESERADYESNGNHVETCPDEVQGNLCRVRNFILQGNEDADCVVIMDDDCRGVGRFEHNTSGQGPPVTMVTMDSDELIRFAEQATVMSGDGGIKMWGINCVSDPMAYREYTPFGFVSYIGGPFSGHCKTDLFYDERLPLKEDYDLTLQHLYKYKRVLRFNGYYYLVDQAIQGGGCASYRNSKREAQQFNALQGKWGKKIVRKDRASRREFDFNPILKFPLKGV